MRRARTLLGLLLLLALAACNGSTYDSPARDDVLEDVDASPEGDAGVEATPDDPCFGGACESPDPVAVLDDTFIGTPPPEPPMERPLPTCDDVDERLLADFGLVIQPGTLSFGGLAPADIDCEDRVEVYRMFVAPFGYEGYVTRLDPARPITMHLYRSAEPRSGYCSGYVPNASAIQIRDLRQCLRSVTDAVDARFRSIAMFLIHEVGHVLANRNTGIKAELRDAGLPAADPGCYDGGFLVTYAFRSGVSPVSESFAESLALFVWNHKRGRLGTIEDFAADCPHTHDFARTRVFEYRP